MLRTRPWSLRRRLVLWVTGLIALAGIVVGIALPVILRGYLVDRVDDQLRAAADRVSNFYDDENSDDRDTSGPPQGLIQPGQAVGTLGAMSDGSVITECAYLDEHGEPTSCTAQMVVAIGQLYVKSEPKSVHLPGLGGYRVVTVQTDDGVYVAGLPLHGANETVGQLILVEVIVVGVVLLLAALVTATMIEWTLRPLRRVAATARQVSHMPLDKGEVELQARVAAVDAHPNTEVGQVGSALNQLLDHVGNALDARQRSESQVRAFVADASHELRTPLAAIRGYAELTRMSRQEVPEDIAHALRRIESESERMTALVQDLLLLARLDSGRPLRSETVDLVPLIVDAVSDAHAAGPTYQWTVTLPEHSVDIVGDPLRLHQVLANLLSNARTHTPEGTTVRTSLTLSGGGAVIEVTDNGPGIAPALLPQVFDRFARGDSSRSRARGSTGLGLAIVQAVVSSHGGRVSVHSATADGSRESHTTFRVELPVAAERRSPGNVEPIVHPVD